MSGEVVHTAHLSLPPPAQAPGGGVQALGLGKLIHNVLGEELVAAIATGQHNGGQFG